MIARQKSPNPCGAAIGAAPTITSVSPSTAAVGSAVAINGTDFGSGGSIRFNGLISTPIIWSDTLIVAPIPTGATTGDVIVTVTGQASNGQSITVEPMSLAFTSYSSYGDSITQAALYVQRVRDQFSLASAFEGRALMGTTSFEMLDRIYWMTNTPGGLPLYTTLIGTNNFAHPGDTPRGSVYRHSIAAALAWLATPTSYAQKVNGRDTTKVTYTGTWADQTIYTRIWPMRPGEEAADDGQLGNTPPWLPPSSAPLSNTQPAPIGKYTTEHAATAEFKISGSVIYIFMTRWSKFHDYGWGISQDDHSSFWGEPENNGWCEYFVDGVSQDWYGSGNSGWLPVGSIRSISAYQPPWGWVAANGYPAREVQNVSWWIRIDGLSPGEHDVRLEAYTNSGNPGSNPDDKVSFEWAVGLPMLPASSLNSLPRVYPIPVLPRYDGGLTIGMEYMHEILSDVVSTLRGDGLTNIRGTMPIIPLDEFLHFNPGDPIHPNTAGQNKIADDVLAFILGGG